MLANKCNMLLETIASFLHQEVMCSSSGEQHQKKRAFLCHMAKLQSDFNTLQLARIVNKANIHDNAIF
eukprot:6519660-Ditylum_brightwellii.AAC.1